jgi:hypothetical protein
MMMMTDFIVPSLSDVVVVKIMFEITKKIIKIKKKIRETKVQQV